MSPMDARLFAGAIVGLFGGVLVGACFMGWAVDYLKSGRKKPPAYPPVEPGYPARNIEVNGFRYVLEEKEK